MIRNITECKKNALNSSVERCCINTKSSNKTEWKNREDIPFYSKFLKNLYSHTHTHTHTHTHSLDNKNVMKNSESSSE